jgi:hypothetical protein
MTQLDQEIGTATSGKSCTMHPAHPYLEVLLMLGWSAAAAGGAAAADAAPDLYQARTGRSAGPVRPWTAEGLSLTPSRAAVACPRQIRPLAPARYRWDPAYLPKREAAGRPRQARWR